MDGASTYLPYPSSGLLQDASFSSSPTTPSKVLHFPAEAKLPLATVQATSVPQMSALNASLSFCTTLYVYSDNLFGGNETRRFSLSSFHHTVSYHIIQPSKLQNRFAHQSGIEHAPSCLFLASHGWHCTLQASNLITRYFWCSATVISDKRPDF